VNLTLTSINGIKVGHATKGKTGCTVVLFEPEAMVAVDARGGYPTTFDTDGISIGKTYVKRHGIFLSGGDVFGLQAATGVQKYLIERGIVSVNYLTLTDEALGFPVDFTSYLHLPFRVFTDPRPVPPIKAQAMLIAPTMDPWLASFALLELHPSHFDMEPYSSLWTSIPHPSDTLKGVLFKDIFKRIHPTSKVFFPEIISHLFLTPYQ